MYLKIWDSLILTILKACIFKENLNKVYPLRYIKFIYEFMEWPYWSCILLDSSQVSNQQDAMSKVYQRNTVRFFLSDGPYVGQNWPNITNLAFGNRKKTYKKGKLGMKSEVKI